jgi:hypothetical protein
MPKTCHFSDFVIIRFDLFLANLILICELYIKLYIILFARAMGFFLLASNGFVYGELSVCVRGFFEGKSNVTKQATIFI